MRFRSVEAIMKLVRANYYHNKIRHYFFTDDNFCRNKNWEAIFDSIISLRAEEGIRVAFNIQVDTKSYLIPRFIEKAAQAGCTQVFIGMESLNEENMKAAGKIHNLTADFKKLIKAYHDAGIVTHLAYIIGFPYDSETSVHSDMIRLRELEAEQASFFMLTPIPGSADYCKALSNKLVMDAGLDNFDSFHETFCHPNMKSRAWTRVYEEAWRSFYSLENMKRILKKAPPEKYWNILLNFVWVKNAVQVEGGHPLLHGFFRWKSRGERSKNYPIESLWMYFKRRTRDIWYSMIGWLKLFLEMEEVWLASRPRGALEERVLFELAQYQKSVLDWRNIRLSELQGFYQKAGERFERSYQWGISSSIRIPSRFQLWLKKWNIFSDSLTSTRRPMNEFWRNVGQYLKQGKITQIRFFRVVFNGFLEFVLFTKFMFNISKHSY
jgi:hypothetical protein